MEPVINRDLIYVDPNMVHVILSAFSEAFFAGKSSLNAKIHRDKDMPHGEKFINAEARVLKSLNYAYPDIVSQYFDISQV